MQLDVALFQPDIPGNTGAILRLTACLKVQLHIIEPTGFDLSDRNLRRAGMDYIELAHLQRHISWDFFLQYVKFEKKRLVLFTTKTNSSYYNFNFHDNDILLFGRETAGVPDYVNKNVDEKVTIPMANEARSLNLAMATAMAIAVAKYPK